MWWFLMIVTKRWLFCGNTERRSSLYIRLLSFSRAYKHFRWYTTRRRAFSLSLIRLTLRNSESRACSVPLPSILSQAFSNLTETNTANPWLASSIFISTHLQTGLFHPLWPACECAQSPPTHAHLASSACPQWGCSMLPIHNCCFSPTIITPFLKHSLPHIWFLPPSLIDCNSTCLFLDGLSGSFILSTYYLLLPPFLCQS